MVLRLTLLQTYFSQVTMAGCPNCAWCHNQYLMYSLQETAYLKLGKEGISYLEDHNRHH